MSIVVNNITKLYGTQKALDAVSLKINPGEIVGLLGPNGAGKSTLMKILACFLPQTSGDASVCGFDVLDQSIEVRKRVGYLPENNPLYLDLYVREFLEFITGIRQSAAGTQHSIHGKRYKVFSENREPGTENREPRTENREPRTEKRITDIIDLTGLGSEQHKKIGALSKGYRQRVGLAQALLHDPEVLILDEPTSGLDPNQIVEIRSLIQEIGKAKTVILSTHIMQEVEAICDRSIIIHKGKIVADDLTKNIHNLLLTKSIIRVEFGSPVEPGKLLTIPGVIEALESALNVQHPASSIQHLASTTWHLVAEPSTDIRRDVFNFAVQNHLTVLSLLQEEQKLEEVFQELTKN
jgi:ABC-2 type transport system ATP-binding protein